MSWMSALKRLFAGLTAFLLLSPGPAATRALAQMAQGAGAQAGQQPAPGVAVVPAVGAALDRTLGPAASGLSPTLAGPLAGVQPLVPGVRVVQPSPHSLQSAAQPVPVAVPRALSRGLMESPAAAPLPQSQGRMGSLPRQPAVAAPARAQDRPAAALQTLHEGAQAVVRSAGAGFRVLHGLYSGSRRGAAEGPDAAAVPGRQGSSGRRVPGLTRPAREAAEPDLRPETREVLGVLGLDHAAFRALAAAQAEFEAEALESFPAARRHVFSLRTQERFSKTVLAVARELRGRGIADPLGKAFAYAVRNFYGDMLDGAALPELFSKARARLPVSAADEAFWGGPALPERRGAGDSLEDRVARALENSYPVLFRQAPGADREFMAALRSQAERRGDALSVLWSHPFSEDRQLIGHKVPLDGKDRLVFGRGEILRRVAEAGRELSAAAAQGRSPRRFVLLVKNIEAMDPGVRTMLQEALRIGVITHPDLGRVVIPRNLSFLFTLREGADLGDDSFYDRVVVKSVRAEQPQTAHPGYSLPAGVAPENYLRHVTVRREGGRYFLVLPGAEIALSPEFDGISPDDLHDALYLKTGLVLDFETVRLLAAMAHARAAGEPILRVQGPTGLGKTHTAKAFAKLTGRPFYANPINPGSDLADLIGGFEQDEGGTFRSTAGPRSRNDSSRAGSWP